MSQPDVGRHTPPTRPPVGSESLWTRFQYRVLKRLAPGEPTHMSGVAYANKSKLQVLLGAQLLDEIRGKDVLDFGCGVGSEAIEIAHFARSVFGLDILPRQLEEARSRARAAGVSDRCTFGTEPPSAKVDAIISLCAPLAYLLGYDLGPLRSKRGSLGRLPRGRLPKRLALSFVLGRAHERLARSTA